MALFSKKFFQKGLLFVIPPGMIDPFMSGQVLNTLPASIPAIVALR